uniref:N-terminal acetyltransferase B complex subunit MDM20 homolog n=1 Tax=Hirondellea gigas TaxID=1518452 RepID=A0A6A7FX51_9CRUS
MAGRAVVDESIVERRLRPVYEWLDLGYTRKAIQECDKVLKKQPSLQCARILRALALLRLGKPDEAENAVAQVVQEGPTDDSTLQVLTIYYREIHDLEKICEIYEEATRKDSKSEELLSQLFMAYVRVANYKKQQLTAMALYKLKPKNPYYFWAVISIVMQARELPAEDSSAKVCLTLAERMVEKFFKEGKLEAEAEVVAYLYILELQNKYTDALDILDSDLADKITQQPANFLQLKRVHYHVSLQHWQEANNICRDLIDTERDNWQHYEGLCSSALKLHAERNIDGDMSVLEGCVKFLRDVLADSIKQHGTKYRAPYLALMQLVYALNDAGLQDLVPKLGVRMEDEMLGYLSRFGSKWCAFSDVRRFFPLIPQESVPALLQQLRDRVVLDDDGFPQDVHMLHSHLTWLQVSRCLQTATAADSTVNHHLQSADELVQLYNNTQHLACQTTATDIRRNDIYVVLASHSVLHALSILTSRSSGQSKSGGYSASCDGHTKQYTNETTQSNKEAMQSTIENTQSSTENNQSTTESNQSTTEPPQSTTESANADIISQHRRDLATASQLLVKLAAILEAAVASSKANFQLKLLLLQVYNMIGASGSCSNCYESLEIKSVQLDTLGNVLALQAVDAAHYNLATSIFSPTNSFFVNAAKDTCEPMMQAYKYGSLTRIPEFGEFRERLEQSVHFSTVTAEQMLLDLTYTCSNHKAAVVILEMQSISPEEDRPAYGSLVDNTDHSVKIAWRCVYSEGTEENSNSNKAQENTAKSNSSSGDTSNGCDSNNSSCGDNSRGCGSSKRACGKRSCACSNPSLTRPAPVVLDELKARTATLRLLGAAYNASKGRGGASNSSKSLTNGTVDHKSSSSISSKGVEQLTVVLAELQHILAHKQNTDTTDPSSSLATDCTTLGCSRTVGSYLRGGYVQCILEHATLLLHMHQSYRITDNSNSKKNSNRENSQVSLCEASLLRLFTAASTQLKILNCTAATASISNTMALHTLHHTLQTVGIVFVLLGFSSTVMRGSRAAGGGKKNRKKKDSPAQVESVKEFLRYVRWIESRLESLSCALTVKLETAKTNSRNNVASLYSSVSTCFTDALNGEWDVAHVTPPTPDAIDVDMAQLTITDRLTNGVDNKKKKNMLKNFPAGAAAAPPQDLTKTEMSVDSLDARKPDFVKICLIIDSSYQESLANLKNSVAAKLKYVSSLKL